MIPGWIVKLFSAEPVTCPRQVHGPVMRGAVAYEMR